MGGGRWRREGVAISQGMRPGGWRSREGPPLRVELARFCAHLALAPASACGGRGFSPRLWHLLTAAPGSVARSSARAPAKPAPPPAGASHPQGASLGPPTPALASGRPRGQEEEAAPPRGLSTLLSPPSENLTSGDPCRPQWCWPKQMEADGHGRRLSQALGLLASGTAEALLNLDPAQLPGSSEGPERTSVLRAGPYHGAGSQGRADRGPQWLSLRGGKGPAHPLLLRALGQAGISASSWIRPGPLRPLSSWKSTSWPVQRRANLEARPRTSRALSLRPEVLQRGSQFGLHVALVIIIMENGLPQRALPLCLTAH